MPSIFDRDLIVYMDSEFVARKYEEITDSSPTLTIAKSLDLSAGIGLLGMKADATVRETRSYAVSIWKMLEETWAHISAYPKFSGQLSIRPVWFEGMLGVGGAEHKKTSMHTQYTKDSPPRTERKVDHLGDDTYFVLRTSPEFSIPMLTRQQYFSSGYDQILLNTHGERPMIWVHVHILGKVLFRNPAYDVSMMVPYLIYSGESLDNIFDNKVSLP